MATQAEALRETLSDLSVVAQRDLSAFWATMAGESPDVVRDGLLAVLPLLGERYGDIASTIALDQFVELRDAAGAPGSFSPEPVDLPTPARWEALARWGVDPLYASTPDRTTALTRVSGGLQRTVADAHRLTIVRNVKADRAATGWKRVGVGANCGFCQLLISRGGVYSKDTAVFKSHDHCNCGAAPVWDPTAAPVSAIAYQASHRISTETDRQRVRKAIASM